jgi:lipopolysaccharide/colanic/teichoic acid biosynthesis glycosyltransferase
MIATIPRPRIESRDQPTIWGLKPTQIHDRFWAARGVQVVRQGDPSEISEAAELFLLLPPGSLVLFRLGPLVNTLSWLKPKLLLLRLRDGWGEAYREIVVADSKQRLVRFQRVYGAARRQARLALTPDPRLARQWQSAADLRAGWRRVRTEVSPARRTTSWVTGRVYDEGDSSEVMHLVNDLIESWHRPDSTVRGLERVNGRVWISTRATVNPEARFRGPVWVGAGRRVDREASVVGPAVLWDEPGSRPPLDTVDWKEIQPTAAFEKPPRPRRTASPGYTGKRLFDLLFAVFGLLLTLPLYPLIILAIWLEDGRPFFFAHRRETLGGKAFPCFKFRSMRKDAEKLKAELRQKNQVDGPQFFIRQDPRLTRVGRFLRASKLDEIPQFLNVLRGDMSVVGPRPSPFEENQYCPAWREARLSVRPGITGLWQVKRSRSRGLDFQEWIRYDIEYVEKASLGLDLWILLKTIGATVRGR